MKLKKVGTTKLTANQYRVLIGKGGWNRKETKMDQWKNLPDFLGQPETLAIYASGDTTEKRIIHNYKAVGGVDRLRYETKPKKNESEGNADHYVIEYKSGIHYLHGPFTNGTPLPHWFEYKDLDPFPYDE